MRGRDVNDSMERLWNIFPPYRLEAVKLGGTREIDVYNRMKILRLGVMC